MRRIIDWTMSALLLFCAPALAAPRATPARPAASPPANTPAIPAATFGDWSLICAQASASGKTACAVQSVLSLPGQKQPIAQIAFGHPRAPDKPAPDTPAPDTPAPDQPGADKQALDNKAPDTKADADKTADAAGKTKPDTTRLTILVPVSVTIAPGIEVIADTFGPHLNIPVMTCIPAACFGEIQLSDAQMQAFHNRTRPGEIIFTDPGGRPVEIQLSFKGLDEALDALAKK